MFKDNLVNLLNKNGTSAYKMAKDLGISINTAYGWVRSDATPTAKSLDMLAKYFGVSVDYLVSGRDEPLYATDEAAEMAKEINNDPAKRMLFKATKNASPEEIKKIIAMFEIIRESKGGDNP